MLKGFKTARARADPHHAVGLETDRHIRMLDHKHTSHFNLFTTPLTCHQKIRFPVYTNHFPDILIIVILYTFTKKIKVFFRVYGHLWAFSKKVLHFCENHVTIKTQLQIRNSQEALNRFAFLLK